MITEQEMVADVIAALNGKQHDFRVERPLFIARVTLICVNCGTRAYASRLQKLKFKSPSLYAKGMRCEA